MSLISQEEGTETGYKPTDGLVAHRRATIQPTDGLLHLRLKIDHFLRIQKVCSPQILSNLSIHCWIEALNIEKSSILPP